MSYSLILLAVLAAGLVVYGEVYARHAAGRWPADGAFMAFRDGDLHVRRFGDAEAAPVLLIHGSSANGLEFTTNLIPELETDHRVIVPDRLGAGHSHRPPDAHLLAAQAEAMAHVLEQDHAAPAVIVGHSFGGAAALRLAIDRPDLVKALVLLAPVSHPWDGKPRLHNKLAANALYGPAFSRLLPLVGPALSSGGMADIFGPQSPPEAYRAEAGLGLLFRPNAFRSNALDMVAINDELFEQTAAYAAIAAPTVIFSGAKDQVLSPALHAGNLSKTLADVRLVKLPETGHMPHHYHAADIAEAVRTLSAGDKLAFDAGRTAPAE